MPASRTRKKASQKKAAEHRQREQKARHEAVKRYFGPLLDKVPNCTTCQGERAEVAQEEVPAEKWEKLAPMREALAAQGLAVRQIAYCPHCQEYSVLSDWNSF
jgi:hypothetical protein